MKKPFTAFLWAIFAGIQSFSTQSDAAPKVAYEYELPPFEHEFQGNAPWCWAATVKMVLSHYKRDVDTCEVVSKTLGKSCCGWFSSAACWVGSSPIQGLRAYGINYKYIKFTPNYETTATIKLAEEVIRQIRKGNMPILRFNNVIPGYPGHVAVVSGVDGVHNPSTLRFHVMDPALGNYYISARNLLLNTYEVGEHRSYLEGLYVPQ